MSTQTNVEEIVQGCTKWINDNSLNGYRGSLRSLVRWYVINRREYRWISMNEVDEATKALQKIFPQCKMSITKACPTVQTAQCIACGKPIEADNMCNECIGVALNSCFERR